MARMKVDFTGFEQVLDQLKQVQGDIHKATEKALIATHEIVTKKALAAIKPHRETGVTEESLRLDPLIKWQGDTAEVKVGFDIKNGGLPSIFLMYGTPRIKPDKKLYNAFYGNATKKEYTEAQEDVFFDELDNALRW